jgi:hypothetical protein
METQRSSDPLRPLWLYPVDGLSIQVYPGWSGKPEEARYAQSVGYGAYTGGGIRVDLRDDEIIYIRPNPSTATPFGLGPLEVAFTSIARQLGVGEFAGNLTSNARPGIMINLGEGVDKDTLGAFRNYWTAEVEGQGKVPITGMKGGDVMRLHPEGDNALYLKYQEFLKSEIATAFDLSPQNLGIERDVNRSTGEVSQERDWDQAIKPRAKELAAYLTRTLCIDGWASGSCNSASWASTARTRSDRPKCSRWNTRLTRSRPTSIANLAAGHRSTHHFPASLRLRLKSLAPPQRAASACSTPQCPTTNHHRRSGDDETKD